MKHFAIIAFGICLFTITSCGDSNSEPENSKHYTAEYLESSPGNSTTEDYFTADYENTVMFQATKYSVSTSENQIETAPTSQKRTTIYNLYLKENSATLSVDTIRVGSYHYKYTEHATIYTIEPGTYKVDRPDLNPMYSMWVVVTESKMSYYYIENETNTKFGETTLVNLVNYKYTVSKKSDNAVIDDGDITTSYKGTFSVTSSSAGLYTLSNEDYTFSFNETTGELTMTQPRREDAIELDLAK
jgi:hypothetical protein